MELVEAARAVIECIHDSRVDHRGNEIIYVKMGDTEHGWSNDPDIDGYPLLAAIYNLREALKANPPTLPDQTARE